MAELWTDRQNQMDQENNKLLEERYKGILPLYFVMTPDGREIARLAGRPSVDEFVAFLRKGLPSQAEAR